LLADQRAGKHHGGRPIAIPFQKIFVSQTEPRHGSAFGVAIRSYLSPRSFMQKITPFAMVAFLGASAVYFSAHSKGSPQTAAPAPAVKEAPAKADPTPAKDEQPAPPTESVFSNVKATPWPQESSDIPVDPKMVSAPCPTVSAT
jgi:hypothetical protein